MCLEHRRERPIAVGPDDRALHSDAIQVADGRVLEVRGDCLCCVNTTTKRQLILVRPIPAWSGIEYYSGGMAASRNPLDDLFGTIGHLADQLRLPGSERVDDLVGELIGGRPAPGRPLSEVQASSTRWLDWKP